MESKHTPGPWHCKNSVGYVYGPDCVVAVCGDFKDKELVRFNAARWNADACLIAAAPDLLEALREAELQIVYLHQKFKETGTGNGVLARIAAAITKAEGR